MQEVSRIRRFIDKSTGKANFPQHTIDILKDCSTRGCRLCNQRSSHLRQNILKMSNECAWPVKLSPLLSRSQIAHVSKLRSVPVFFRRSWSCYPNALHQVQPGGSFAHSGRDFPVASLTERGSPFAAGQTSPASWLAIPVASDVSLTEGVRFVWSTPKLQGHHSPHRSQGRNPPLCSPNWSCMQPTQSRRTQAHICWRTASQGDQQRSALEGGRATQPSWLFPTYSPLFWWDWCLDSNAARIYWLPCWQTSQKTRKACTQAAQETTRPCGPMDGTALVAENLERRMGRRLAWTSQ